jgi:uncharacterized membrane protein
MRTPHGQRGTQEEPPMAPLIVLLMVTVLARVAGQLRFPALRSWPAATRVGLAVMFLFTAVAHFNAMRSDLVRMVPPVFPNPELMVTVTGICEVLGAIGLLIPGTRRWAGLALIVFLIVVLPANVHAARTGVTLRGAAATPVVPRVAMQALFIGLLWWSACRAVEPSRPTAVNTSI